VRDLTEDNYTITPVTKSSVRRILSSRDHDKRRAKLTGWLDRQKVSTQTLYSLITLAIASDHLALDKYAIFYVCGTARSQRTLVVKLLDQAVHKYLSKTKCTIHPTHTREIKESTDCPPLVKREYRLSEHPTKLNDLAVLYRDGKCEIPRTWVPKYVEGRGLVRDGYQFAGNLTMPIVHAASALSHLVKDRDLLLNWAKQPRQEVEGRLHNILQCYRFDRYYQMITEDSPRSFIFAGLALFDFDYSQAYSFKTKSVELSRFLLKR